MYIFDSETFLEFHDAKDSSIVTESVAERNDLGNRELFSDFFLGNRWVGLVSMRSATQKRELPRLVTFPEECNNLQRCNVLELNRLQRKLRRKVWERFPAFLASAILNFELVVRPRLVLKMRSREDFVPSLWLKNGRNIF